MKFSNIQISVINNISKGVIYDLDMFLKDHFEYDESKCVGTYLGDYYEFKNGQTISVIKNNEELINKTAELISLIEFLKTNKLIHIIKKSHSKKEIFPLFYKATPNASPEPYQKFFQMVNDYHDKEFLPLPEIHSFVARKYKTNEELNIELEKKDRQESQRLTRRIAYITITVSIIVAISSSIINYLTYTNDRNVKIINTKDFRDTVSIKIIPTDTTLLDSTNQKVKNESENIKTGNTTKSINK